MKHQRLIIAVIVSVLLISLILYQVTYQDIYDPDIEYIFAHIEDYSNTSIAFTGEIIEADAMQQHIIVAVGPPPLLLTVTLPSHTDEVAVGDIVEISGILHNRSHVTAQQLVHFERWKFDLIYIRSLPAIPFVLYLFFRTWRFDLKTFYFQRRRP